MSDDSADVEMKEGSTVQTAGEAAEVNAQSKAKEESSASPTNPKVTTPTAASESKEDTAMSDGDRTDDEEPSASNTVATDAAADSHAFTFPPFAEPAQSQVKEFDLPSKWTAPAPAKKAKKAKSDADGGDGSSASTKKKSKGEDAAAGAKTSSPDADKKKAAAAKEREAQRAKEKAAYDRIVPEPGMTAVESFEKLVKEILLGGGKPAAGVAAPTPNELAAYRQWEIPYIAHFTWLFHKPLSMRPLEPMRVEQVILDPLALGNESTFSELASKLLLGTRLTYSPHYKKLLTQMGKSQKCFPSECISEWMFWVIELWIEQWKERQKMEEEEEEGEGEEGEEGEGKKAAAKKKKPAAADAEDSDLDSENEDEEEKAAYNLHEVPERKWLVNTEELFGNVNPFTGEAPPPAVKTEDEPMADVDAPAATASSTDADAATPAAAPANSGPPLPIRRKSFHELSLTHRVTLLKLLCDYQLAMNPHYQAALKELEPKELRVEPVGADASGKRYFFFGFADYRIYCQGYAAPITTPKSTAEIAAEEEAQRVFNEDVAKEVARLKELQAIEESKKKDAAKAEKEAKKEAKLAKERAKAEEEERIANEKKRKREEKMKARKAAKIVEDEDAPLSLLVAAQPTVAPIAIPPTPTLPMDKKTMLANWTAVSPNHAAAAPGKPTLSAPATPSKPPPSSLAFLPSPNARLTTNHAPAASNSTVAAANNTANGISSTPSPSPTKKPNGAATAATPSSTAPASAAAATAAPANSPGLPFALLPSGPDAPVEKPREIIFQFPAPPPFSLLTTSSAQLRALLARLKPNNEHPRNAELYKKLKTILTDLDEGRGRKLEEEDAGKGKGKNQPAAPKRISDRLVSVEAQREEAERARLLKAEEDSRARYTRRNRILDRVSERNALKVRRAYEKFMGIEHEKRHKERVEDEEMEESATDDETSGRRRGASRFVRVTRNRGKATKSLAESDHEESETESEAEAEDDEGCAKCGTVTPPEDGSNPILLCDNLKCNRQYCLQCIPLERMPPHSSKWFCPECVALNPRIR